MRSFENPYKHNKVELANLLNINPKKTNALISCSGNVVVKL